MNGIQEVSGSIPLISTKSSLGEGKNLEIERFQGFFFSKSGKIAVFAICACALDFLMEILKIKRSGIMKKIKLNCAATMEETFADFLTSRKAKGLADKTL